MPDNEIISVITGWSHEFSDSLKQSDSLFIALFSADRELLFANKAMAHLFKGNPHESLINPSFDQLLSSGNSSPLIFDGFLTLGDYDSVNTSIHAKVYRKDNKLLILGGVNAAQLFEQGRTLHQLNSEINNLQRALLREKYSLENTLSHLNEANNQLSREYASRDKLFSIIAHDLRSPFQTLLGFSDLLMDNTSNYTHDEVVLFAQKINHVAKNTYTLLENLLEWSRLQTGRHTPSMAKVGSASLVNEILLFCRPMFEVKEISLTALVHEDEILWADKQMTKTVLRNLLSNALKFTDSKGNVTIETKRLESFVQFSVTDNGTGIEPGYFDTLFSVESSLSAQGTSNEKGSGLGLILCKDLVELHGGKIWVESQVRKGSSFIFTLPLFIDRKE